MEVPVAKVIDKQECLRDILNRNSQETKEDVEEAISRYVFDKLLKYIDEKLISHSEMSYEKTYRLDLGISYVMLRTEYPILKNISDTQITQMLKDVYIQKLIDYYREDEKLKCDLLSIREAINDHGAVKVTTMYLVLKFNWD